MTHLDELVSAANSLDETPPPEAGARMWGNVAAKVAANVAGGAAVGVAVATAGANSASAATAATSSFGLTLAKVGAAVALTAGIGVGVAAVTAEPEPAPVESVASVGSHSNPPTRRGKTVKRTAAPEETAAEPEAEPEPEEVLEVLDEAVDDEVDEPAPKPKARPRKRPQRAAEPASVLADESALLGKAKVAVSAGRNKDALAAIRDHASKFPGGELAEVRRALEVKVLCNLGRTAEARKAADRFLLRHRRSALAGQVRSSCAYDSDASE
ncbi:MAG: hypothetical protein ACE37F_17630 [Nannocystaceae bacterium]|nr:hypothetical protein [bacterium]